jgi:glycosyltransferase involved in cell wall biosynthesis
MEISVIIPTYNPNINSLTEVINGLRAQTLSTTQWELIIIDNNSTNGALSKVDIAWHPNGKIIKELKQGLTHSRITGINGATGSIIIMVDDDNVLAPNYLEATLVNFEKHPGVGAMGGKITGVFNNYTPEKWTEAFWGMLAIRDLGDEPIISATDLLKGYPTCSPVGAGMAMKKALLADYIQNINKGDIITDRAGNSLASGGDNEIVINILKKGYSAAYFPNLLLGHIIPASRLTKAYLARLNYESARSWIMLLLKYNICQWPVIKPYTVLPRKIKAWIMRKAWKNQANYINWRGACGLYEGLSTGNKNA